MAFTICRAEKLKSFGNIGAAGEHCNRTRLTPNSDIELRKYNSRPIGSDKLVEDVKRRIFEIQGNKELRKNGVIAIEQLLSASPELFKYEKKEGRLVGNDEAWDKFEKASIDWLKTFYGEKNVVAVYVHKDEKSPHIQAFIVPEVNGKMNAKHFLGGREKLSQMQDSFAAAVEHCNINRGIKGSRADHQTLKQFYGQVEQAMRNDLAVKLVYNPKKPKIELPLPPIMSGRKEYKEEQENAVNGQINKFESGFLESQDYIRKLATARIFKPFADEKQKVDEFKKDWSKDEKIRKLTIAAEQKEALVQGIKQAFEEKSFAPIVKVIQNDTSLKRQILNENKGYKMGR